MVKLNKFIEEYNLKQLFLRMFYFLCAMFLLGLLYGSYKKSDTYALTNYLPSEESKAIDFSKYNDFPVTLEEEVVSQMAPIGVDGSAPNMNYKPILDALHDAAPIDYNGVN
jgi:hypothetical protein